MDNDDVLVGFVGLVWMVSFFMIPASFTVWMMGFEFGMRLCAIAFGWFAWSLVFALILVD